MLKLKMMLCVMMLPLVVVGCTSKRSVSQYVKPPRIKRQIIAAHRLADAQLNGIISPIERLITMQKQLEGTEVLMSSADRLYRWATHAIIVSNTRPSRRSINA